MFAMTDGRSGFSAVVSALDCNVSSLWSVCVRVVHIGHLSVTLYAYAS